MRSALGALLLTLVACGGSEPDIPATSPTPEVGWIADLTTRSHGVRGRVTVTNPQTLVLSNFFYDGGGLSNVQAYLAKGSGFATGVAVGPNLAGQPQNNTTLQLPLPAGTSLSDFNAISIWCSDAAVSFGDSAFRSP